MKLLSDRVRISGRTTTLGSFLRDVPLDDIEAVAWNTLDESYNLVLQTRSEAILLHVPHAAQWKFAIEQAFPAVGKPSPGLPTVHHSAQTALRRKTTPAVQTGHAAETTHPTPRRAKELPRPTPAPEPERSLLDGARVKGYEVRRRGPMTLSLQLEDGRTAQLVAYGRVMLHLQMSEDDGATADVERPTPLRAMGRGTHPLLRAQPQA